MARIIRKRQARTDLFELWDYIRNESGESRADIFLARIIGMFELLAEQPGMGRPRDDLRPDLRSHPVGRYLLFYFPLSDGVEVVRVLYGGRDIEAAFEEEE